jgi:predicted nucleic-acid-binding protein
MKVTVDTNILLRAFLHDDPVQARAGEATLSRASLVALTLPCLCEFVWVLSRSYRFNRHEIARAVETLCSASNVVLDGLAVEAGLAQLKEGGDFADGVIAYQGRSLGGETFISFDKKAVRSLKKQGIGSQLLVSSHS